MQDGLIGDFGDYKQATNLDSMKKEKRLITKTGLITGGLVSKARQNIMTTGLVNGTRHDSEAGENSSTRPDLLRDHAKK